MATMTRWTMLWAHAANEDGTLSDRCKLPFGRRRVFILVGTFFEEGGIRKDDTEFGRQYRKYSASVSAFIPRLGFFFGQPIKLD